MLTRLSVGFYLFMVAWFWRYLEDVDKELSTFFCIFATTNKQTSEQ